jgi:chromosome segregation ATPase
MGEMSPPTAADYAWAGANDANREIKNLKRRIDQLEESVTRMAAILQRLEMNREGPSGASPGHPGASS